MTKGDGVLPLDPTEFPAVVAETPALAVDVLSGCRAVVGIDTGLTHIAVQQGAANRGHLPPQLGLRATMVSLRRSSRRRVHRRMRGRRNQLCLQPGGEPAGFPPRATPLPVGPAVRGRRPAPGRSRPATWALVTGALTRSEVNAAAGLGVRNSQPEGIGRVVALGELLCWNNLGRNVVFADHQARPRAVFGTTLFPGQDEPSQYDFDVHAIIDLPELGLVGVLNHIGLLRGFRRADIDGSAGERLIEPSCQWWFVADVERTSRRPGD